MDRKNVEDGFIIEQEHLPDRCYVLTSPWTARSTEIFHREGAQFLRLNRTGGAKVTELEFLRELRGLRGVEIYDASITMQMLAPLLDLKSLELLGLECNFKDIDFAASFPRLRFASFRWQRGCESVFHCPKLQFLFMAGYPGKDLSSLAPLSSLERLNIRSRSLTTVEGVPTLTRLEHLTFAYCSSLLEVDATSLCQALRILELYNCKKVTRLPRFSSCKLQQLTIENGAPLESLEPLLPCRHLEEIYLPGTRIANRDLSPLLSLPRLRRVAFPRDKSYSHSMDEVNATIASRASGI